MRGPAQPEPRCDVPPEVVRHLLQAADDDVATALASADSGGDRRLRQTRQVRLLLQLAAHTGARRGELAALRLDDLHGRVLHIDRAVSAEVVTTTKTGRSRRLTVGMATVELWEQARTQALARQPAGLAGSPWLFAPDDGQGRLSCGALGHGFARFAREYGHGEVTLHRLRHTVATVLVANGQLLHAQQRLGQRDASTTLRQYCHALPLEDHKWLNYLFSSIRTDTCRTESTAHPRMSSEPSTDAGFAIPDSTSRASTAAPTPTRATRRGRPAPHSTPLHPGLPDPDLPRHPHPDARLPVYVEVDGSTSSRGRPAGQV